MLAYLSPGRRQEANDATPERLIVLFYDQVIDSLHTGISAIARNDIQERCNALTTAAELLGDMLQCFELDSDDVIIGNLRQLHSFVIVNLPKVNLYNDAKLLAECIRLLKPIRDAWAVTDQVAKHPLQGGKLPHPAVIPPVAKGGRPRLTLVAPAS
jgi:flagellar protein FliS